MSDIPVIPDPVAAALPPLPVASPVSRRSFRGIPSALRRQGRRWLPRPRRLLAIGALVSVIALCGAVAGLYGRTYLHLRSGRADLERHHNVQALAHFQAYLRTCPNDPDALLLAARASWRLQKFDEAERYLKDYRQAAGVNDDFVRESALVLAARGEVDETAKYCQELLERQDPATPLILEAVVLGCMQKYRLSQAAALLQRWLDVNPDDTQALFLQCYFDHLRQAPEAAIARYHRVLQLDPEHDSARVQLAASLVEQRQYAEALPHLELLQQRQPSNWHALVLLARCQDFLGRQQEAEQLLDHVLAQAPHDAEALADRGRLALRQRQLADAEAWLRHALVHEAANYSARYHLLQCLLQQGKTAEARLQEQRLKQVEKDQKRFREIVTQEMSRKPHDADLFRELALIYLRKGDSEEGIRWLHNALKEDPMSVPLHRALAEYYQQVGNSARAAYHRQFVPPRSAEAAPNGGS
jgi:Tfp pilus assembly protein PilF